MPVTAPGSNRRRLLLSALLLAHAGLLLIAGRERPVPVPASATPIVVTEIAAAAPPSVPVEVKLFPVTAMVDAPELSDADLAAAPSTLAGLAQMGAGCDLSDAVQSRLRASPAALAALQRIPRASRSVADAIMLWDGHWIDARSVGGDAGFAPVRAAVAGAVRAAPASCREAEVAGPRLVIIAGSAGNQVLAFGSGRWAWSQLLAG